MSISGIGCYFTPELRSELLKWARVFQCFLCFLLLSPFILVIGTIVILCRIFVTIHFKLVHEGKFILCSPVDAAFATEKHANTLTVNAFGYFRGQTDIYKLQARLLPKLINYTLEDGHQPFQKLTWKLLQKYGFYAWEIENDFFDIRDHVKLCPGINVNTIYSEQEVLQNLEPLMNDMMNPKRPQWELLYVPKVRMSQDDDDLHYALIIRAQHAYMDGVSIVQLVQHGICDEPGFLTIDPINPPFPKPSVLQLIGVYTQAFFMAPYLIYKTLSFSPPNIFQNMADNQGEKYLQITTKEITLESVKIIRNKLKCSTTALFNSVIAGALRKAAKRKGLPIPEEIDFAYTIAVLPYKNIDPQNRFTIKVIKSPISISDPLKRLNKMNFLMKTIPPHEIIVMYTVSKMVGLLPAALIAKVYTTVTCGYAVSNVPGFTEKLRLNGDIMETNFGCPPIRNGVAFGVGVSSYAGNMRALWTVEKCKIISSRKEMNALITDFENDFAQLECIANGNA